MSDIEKIMPYPKTRRFVLEEENGIQRSVYELFKKTSLFVY